MPTPTDRPARGARAHLDDARAALTRGDEAGAHRACMAVLGNTRDGVGDDHAEALGLLATIATQHANWAKARDVVERALALHPQAPALAARLHGQWAHCASMLGLHAQACARATQAQALQPEDAHTLDTLGVVFARAGDHGRALPCFRAAARRAPRVAAYRYNLATALQFTGDTAAAADEYRACIDRDPAHHAAYPALAALIDTNDVTFGARCAAELAAAEARDDARACLLLGHALATLHARAHDTASEFAALRRAKARERARVAHDPEDDARLFATASELARRVSTRPVAHGAAPPFVFVFGLPRSGTTLVDRIVASHPRVVSAGELPDFSEATKRVAATQSPAILDAETLLAAERADIDTLAQDYVARTRRHAQGERTLVDKMPLDLFYAPLIARAFPNARLVCLRRAPMDVCLGNYRQLFATRFSYYNYALDLEHTARYVAAFERYLAVLEAALPGDRFLRFDYDALVADQAARTRELLAFCGLPWDDACLRFHEHTGAVATASSLQVRKPMYADASGRWRAYAPLLAAARAVFADAGIAID